MDRRHFLAMAGAAAPTMLLAPWLMGEQPELEAATKPRRALVLVELKGGNDGLNTVIPFADPAYARLRPRLAISGDKALKLNAQVGLHPSLDGLMASWAARELAIVQGVGYPAPNRSHFRSIEIWETATDSSTYSDEGWLATILKAHRPAALVADGLCIGDGDSGPLRGDPHTLAVQNPEELVRATQRLIKPTKAQSANPALSHILQTQNELLQATASISKRLSAAAPLRGTFPRSKLGRQLEIAARLIASDMPVLVYKVSHGSFDTHAGQLGRHANLLKQLDDALTAFRDALKGAGKWDDVLVMTYSEFGRRAAQNGSMGTDHGTAAPQFLLGGKVKGGLYGHHPSLTDLAGGDLRHHVDFRQLYATISQRWWGMGNPFAGHGALPLV